MRKECNIIGDLLPLYTEKMVCKDTEDFVKEHLETCEECRKACEQMSKSGSQTETEKRDGTAKKNEAVPLLNLKRKLRKQKIMTVVCTCLFVIALVVSAIAALTAPVYVPYDEELFTITEHADESITITFDERVTDYVCSSDARIGWKGVEPRYEIEAWSTLWDKWFGRKETCLAVIHKVTEDDFSVYYVSNDGSENKCIYGEPITSGGVITLPRLVLGNYFLIAILCTAVLFIVWLITRKNEPVRTWITRILLYPVSYCIGHVIVAGFSPSSYSAQRDFMFIVFLSVVIYGGVMLGRSVYRERKEIKEITGK